MTFPPNAADRHLLLAHTATLQNGLIRRTASILEVMRQAIDADGDAAAAPLWVDAIDFVTHALRKEESDFLAWKRRHEPNPADREGGA